jgi:hypothetical protein
MLTWQVQSVLRATPGLPESLLMQRLEHVLAPGHAKALLGCMQANGLLHSVRVLGCEGAFPQQLVGRGVEPEASESGDLVMIDGGLVPRTFVSKETPLISRMDTCYYVHAECSVQVVAGGIWDEMSFVEP